MVAVSGRQNALQPSDFELELRYDTSTLYFVSGKDRERA